MNQLEEVQEIIRKNICERQQIKKQIAEIETNRNKLAQDRNKMKKNSENKYNEEVKILGNKISELGIQSQELQNELDKKYYETRTQVNLIADNLMAELLRKIRILEVEKKEKNIDVSEDSSIENKIDKAIQEIQGIAKIKKEYQNKNWNNLLIEDEEIYVDEIPQQEIQIEEIFVEEFEPIEELEIEEFEVEEFVNPENTIERKPLKEFTTFGIENDEEYEQEIWKIEEQEPKDEIEKIARAIVEEIAEKQTRDLHIQEVKETTEKSKEEEIITFEKKPEKEEIQTIENINLLNIMAKIENGEVVYKAQLSNGKEINIYPTKSIIGNQLLRDKEKREELKSVLINYTKQNNKIFDKSVINKIDPTICETLIVYANKYNYDAQNLIYNYAMSFSQNGEYNGENLPEITYNFIYLNETYLSKKEKNIISKICRNARKNSNIDIIGYSSKISQIKYLIKKIFAINIVNALPEGNKIKN